MSYDGKLIADIDWNGILLSIVKAESPMLWTEVVRHTLARFASIVNIALLTIWVGKTE